MYLTWVIISGMVDAGKTMLIQHKHNMSDHKLITNQPKHILCLLDRAPSW